MKKQRIKYYRIVSSCFLFGLFYWIYSLQIRYNTGDIPLHLKLALEKGSGYSLNTYIFIFLGRIQLIGYQTTIPVFLSGISVATIFTSYVLLEYLDSQFYKDNNKTALWMLSCLVPFVGSIYLPGIYPFFYENTISPIVWHNATVIEMRLFGLISLLFFFKLFHSEEKFSWKDWCLFTGSLLIGNAFKPSYMIGFAPMAGIWLLTKLIIRRDQTKKVLLIGVGIIISTMPLIYQWIELYGKEATYTGGGLAFVPGARLLQTGNPYLKILCGLSFCIIMLFQGNNGISRISDQKEKCKSIFWFVNGMTFINFFMYCFFLEKNDAGVGNLAWGLKGILYFTVLFGAYRLIKIFNQKKKYAVILSIIPALQLICGIIYTIMLIVRHDFYF